MFWKPFLARLAERNDVPASVVSSFGELLAADRLPKADQLVEMYTESVGESVL
ncbi:MAG: hypothetical protein HQ453_10890 [Actinobacteria bacterium]|nr:hypothetical protein [Actinomycetota bacterium]